MRAALASKKSAVLDNTSPDKATRRTYIEIAKEHGASSAPVRHGDPVAGLVCDTVRTPAL